MTQAKEIRKDMLYILRQKKKEEKRQGRSLYPAMFFSAKPQGSWKWQTPLYYRVALMSHDGKETYLEDGTRTVMSSNTIRANMNGNIRVCDRNIVKYFENLKKCLLLDRKQITISRIESVIL